jgi:hypothetical protein
MVTICSTALLACNSEFLPPGLLWVSYFSKNEHRRFSESVKKRNFVVEMRCVWCRNSVVRYYLDEFQFQRLNEVHCEY